MNQQPGGGPLRVAEEYLHQRALAAASCGITIADARQPDLPLIYVNEAFCAITGYQLEDVLGRNCRFLQGSARDQPSLSQLRAAIQAGEPCKVVLRNFRKNGSLFWNELYMAPVYDAVGVLTHFVGVQTDITARVEAEQALAEANQQLREALEQKNRLLGMAAHDLRTPITVVQGFVDLLSDVRTSAADATEFMGIIREALADMLSLLNNLLDLSAIESGKVQLAPTDTNVYTYLERIVRLQRVLASRKVIQVETAIEEGLPLFPFDRMRVEQVLNNLFSNAFKFSLEGTTVTLAVRRAGDFVEFSVADQGVGISPDEVSRVFHEFQRLRSRPTGNESSTGLGLSICRRIVEMQGGTIGVESRLGEGSRFWFRLPIELPGDLEVI